MDTSKRHQNNIIDKLQLIPNFTQTLLKDEIEEVEDILID